MLDFLLNGIIEGNSKNHTLMLAFNLPKDLILALERLIVSGLGFVADILRQGLCEEARSVADVFIEEGWSADCSRISGGLEPPLASVSPSPGGFSF